MIVLLYLLLIFIGWINIYSAVYNENHKSILDITQNYGKQLIWIATSIILAVFILFIDSKIFSIFSYVIYGISILLLIGVLFIGKEVSGARSWFQIGSFALQPSEFAKFATNLAIAKYLSSPNIKIKYLKTKTLTVVILGIPAILILLQPDAGSAIIYLSFLFVLYREGMSGNIFIILLIALILFSSALLFNKFIVIGALAVIALLFLFFIKKKRKEIVILSTAFLLCAGFVYSVDYVFENVLEKHQKDRINVLYGKTKDIKGVGYNVNQSKIAIGSGGFLGKGFLQGTQTKYNFVPEQSTDFIFCTIGEEWGFVGSSIVIILFIGLFTRIIFIAERQRFKFSIIYGYGTVAILFFHFIINIGMTLGIVPVIGIPLPFFSYGGSSLWSFTILLFIFVKQDADRLKTL